MKYLPPRPVLFASTLLIAASALSGLAVNAGDSETGGRQTDAGSEHGGNRPNPPFACPDSQSSKDGVLKTTLRVAYAKNKIGQDEVYLRSYNGALVGPTFRVRPGDRLQVRLENRLPATDQGSQGLYLPNVTNLHTHGLHVSPNSPADDVFRAVGPGDSFDYEFRIPADHPSGTFWYHPHWHGSVALQVASGMAGALIVEGGLDDVPEIKAAQEKIFLFQQIPYRADGKIKTEGPDNSYPGVVLPNIQGAHTTINGLNQPVIQMAPGEVQRWRLIHAGPKDRLK